MKYSILRCLYCKKKFTASKDGQCKFNKHMFEIHPFETGPKIIKKTFFESLVDELRDEEKTVFKKETKTTLVF